MLQFNFEHHINGVAIQFHGDAASADDAIDVIRKVIGSPVAATVAATTQGATGKNVKASAKNETDNRSPAEPTPTASDSSANSSKDTPAADASKADAAPAIDYDKDVKPLVLQISKGSRDKAMALLQRFGAIDKASGQPSAKALTREQWPDFIADANKVIDGTLDPTKSEDGEMA